MKDQLPALRQARIVEGLRDRGTMSVAELSDLVQASPITVRRDLTVLSEQGLIRRVYGGASIETSPRTIDTGETEHTVGLLLPAYDYHWPDVIRGARDAAHGLLTRLVVQAFVDRPEDGVAGRVRQLLDAGVEALVMAPRTGPGVADSIEELGRRRVPVVLVERDAVDRSSNDPVESVRTDHHVGSGIAARHLAALGHRKVGLVLVTQSPHASLIEAAWHDATRALGLSSAQAVMVERGGPTMFETLSETVAAARAAGTTALLVHADPEAIAVMQAASALGIGVPRELSLIAYDDEVAGLVTPPLTAIRAPRQSLGRAAVELAVARLLDPDRPPHRVVISPRLTVRGTSARPV